MSVLDTITTFLTGKGFSPAQVAGIEGNLQVESGLNPSAYNAGEHAIGLAQWEGGRRTALQSFARARGRTETDLVTQLEFMWSELTGSERSALDAVRATSTPSAAAAAFDQRFERSSGAARQRRIDIANAIYQGKGVDFSGLSTSSNAGVDDSGGMSAGDVVGSILIPGYGVINTAKDDWAGQALAIGLKLVGTVAAIGLVVVGVIHTVKDNN